jgi:signal transduction histidine kinase
MQNFLQEIITLLIRPPGNLIYHIILAFSMTVALQMVLIARQNNLQSMVNRMLIGLAILLIAQISLFTASGLAWQGVLNPHQFLPPFERALIAFSLVWITWLWCFPAPSRIGEIFVGLFTLGTIFFFLLTYIFWIRQPGNLPFNLSIWDWIWQGYMVITSLVGLVVLLLKRPPSWFYGFTMLGVLLVGILAHLLISTPDGDFSGIFRLVSLISFPLLPTLSSRLMAQPTAQVSKNAEIQPAQVKERRRYSADPRTIQAWIHLSSQNSDEAVCSALIRSVARTILSDWCFAVTPADKAGQITLICGFDLIQEQSLPILHLDSTSVPSLHSACQRRRPIRLQATENPVPDVKVLAEILNLTSPASVMYVPFSQEYFSAVGILLVSPYSHREWSVEDQSYVSTMLEFLNNARVSPPESPGKLEVEKMSQILQSNQTALEQLQKENQQLRTEIAFSKSIPSPKPDDDLQALMALQQEAQETIASLQKEIDQLRASLKEATSTPATQVVVNRPVEVMDLSRYEQELTASLKENAYLKNALAQSNTQILQLRDQLKKPSPEAETNIRDMVESLAVELRQPMSSVIGYTDLLLSESVGILGALQRKFMERIKASTERLNTLLDDLLRLSRLSEGNVGMIAQSVEFNAVLDHAISDTSAQLREKSITLELDLPEQLPQPSTDRDTLQLILIHLLQNAALATPMEGTITLRAHQHVENQKEFLQVSVSDSGGGILPEDLPRVFSRRYRNENPLIPGIGDTGVGLVITKSLVEAHGGRIWLESEPGQSTTFHIIIPVQTAQQPVTSS